jgi:hypothetical protein
VNRSPGGIQAAVQQATGISVTATWEKLFSGGRFLVENPSYLAKVASKSLSTILNTEGFGSCCRSLWHLGCSKCFLLFWCCFWVSFCYKFKSTCIRNMHRIYIWSVLALGLRQDYFTKVWLLWHNASYRSKHTWHVGERETFWEEVECLTHFSEYSLK